MLREILNTRQIPGDLPRRWFTDEDMDLVVWFDQDTIAGFQLSYDKLRSERALTWKRCSGFRHESVDDGEGRPGRYKAAPLMLADGDFAAAEVARRFKHSGAEIDRDIVLFVHQKLLEVPASE